MMQQINQGLRGIVKDTDWQCSTCGHTWQDYYYVINKVCKVCESESVKERDAG